MKNVSVARRLWHQTEARGPNAWLIVMGLLMAVLGTAGSTDARAAESTAGVSASCEASACVALSIQAGIAEDRVIQPVETGYADTGLPSTSLLGSYGGERKMNVRLLVARYRKGELSDSDTGSPRVNRLSSRMFAPDRVRRIIAPGDDANRMVIDFMGKQDPRMGPLSLLGPVPENAAEASFWVQAALFRGGPPATLEAYGSAIVEAYEKKVKQGDTRGVVTVAVLVPTGEQNLAEEVGQDWITGTAPLFFIQ